MSRTLKRLLVDYGQPAVLLLIVWWFILASFSGLNEHSIFPMLNTFPLLGLLALGIGVTMIGGELDLSVTAVAAVAGIIAVKLEALGLWGALAVVTVVGAAFGAAQGYVIAKVGINSVVLTIGTLICLGGVAFLFGENIVLHDPTLGDVLLERSGLFSGAIVISLVVFVAVGLFLRYAKAGREIYAAGGDRNEAANAGVRILLTTVRCFAISGGCAALAGAIAAYQGGGVSPTGFESELLPAVAAGLIGGVALQGGRGTVWNIAIGVCILSAITSGLAARGDGSYVAQLVTGGLLIAVIAGEWMTGQIQERATVRSERRRAEAATMSSASPAA